MLSTLTHASIALLCDIPARKPPLSSSQDGLSSTQFCELLSTVFTPFIEGETEYEWPRLGTTIKRTLFLLLVLCSMALAQGQTVAVKTDLLQWATTTPNIGAEVTLGPRLTAALSWAYNPWTFADNRKLRHWSLQPELRYWFWEPFNGHSVGVHGTYTEFNAGGIHLPLGILPNLGNYRYEGKQYGGSLTYGYQWMLTPRWGLEASLGVGYLHSRYHQYQCRTCGLPVDPEGAPQGESPLQTRHYFGPTKAAVSLIFIIH